MMPNSVDFPSILKPTTFMLQSKLVEQISAMLTSFTQRRTEHVNRTVAGLNSQLDSDRNAIGTSFAELHNLATATTGHLQVSGLDISIIPCRLDTVGLLFRLRMCKPVL